MVNYLTLILLFYIPSVLFCQPGQLDETFNLTGKITTHIEDYNVKTNAILIQQNEKIVICGTATSLSNSNDFVVARFNADGTPDVSFNQTGHRVIDFFGKNDYGYAMALQSDDKILITGITTTKAFDRKSVVIRLLEDGSFDEAFGENGIVLNVQDYDGENARGVVYLEDGNIIVAGSIHANSASPVCALFKYHEDGTPDMDFGDQGLATAIVPDSYNPAFGAMQYDGKIITGGFLLGVETEILLVRFSPQGIIDSTFGSNGIVRTHYANENHFAYSILVQPDRKILVVDGITHGGERDFGMIRYTEDGLIDSTFGTHGLVFTDFLSGSNTAHAISLQEDQKILLAGFLGITPHHDFALARYMPDGSLDPGFGFGGKVIADFGNDDLAYSMAIQQDNKIVLAGHSVDDAGNNDFALARFFSGLEIVGTTEPLAEVQNLDLYPNPISREAVLKYSLPKDQVMIIRMYDLNGKLIQRFLENAYRGRGDHEEKLMLNANILSGIYVLAFETMKSTHGVPIIVKSP